jgi:hypothetical protein
MKITYANSAAELQSNEVLQSSVKQVVPTPQGSTSLNAVNSNQIGKQIPMGNGGVDRLLPRQCVPSLPPAANMDEVNRLLLNKGWPTGLRRALIVSVAISPTRYIICDSSGGMSTPDGYRISGEGSNSK